MPVLSPQPAVAQDTQLLVFQAGDEEYAFPLTEVQEIVESPAITAVPCVQACVSGVLNLRNKIVTVINLPKLLGLPTSEHPRHVIVASKGNELFGFRVDTVTGVLRVGSAELQPVSQAMAASVPASYVGNALIRHPRIILVLRLNEMLNALSPASV